MKVPHTVDSHNCYNYLDIKIMMHYEIYTVMARRANNVVNHIDLTPAHVPHYVNCHIEVMIHKSQPGHFDAKAAAIGNLQVARRVVRQDGQLL